MKYLIKLCAILCSLSLWSQGPNSNFTSFNFDGKKWLFPSTVEEAVKKHQLNYKPPGKYYKIELSGMETILSYHFNSGDFYNEYQPKETLYSRKLHSYVFRFPDKPGLYDSLRQNLERTYNKKFILTEGLKEGVGFQEHEKLFEYDFLTINTHLTIGLKKSSSDKVEKKVVVRFMYDLPLGRMGVVMGSY